MTPRRMPSLRRRIRSAHTLKCVEELSAGNTEFAAAKRTIARAIADMDRPEVKYFMETFAPSFELSLDEMG